jgi:hypothetical protein
MWNIYLLLGLSSNAHLNVSIQALPRLVFISGISAGLTYVISHEEKNRNEGQMASPALWCSLNIACILLPVTGNW